MNKLAILLVQFYRATFSYFLGGNCRYYPSCSCYAQEAFEKLPFTSALKLTIKRVLSCHPFNQKKSFYDPVPVFSNRGLNEQSE